MDKDILVLSDLQKGMPGISPVEGAFLQENAVVALHNAGHHSLTTMSLSGIVEKDVDLKWDDDSLTKQMKASYNDDQENIEFAAMGISALLTPYLTDFTIIMRSRKGSGFDYTLGLKNCPFVPKAILEVSGISRESANNTISKRAIEKRNQISQSDDLQLEEYISIVEFASPKVLYKLVKSFNDGQYIKHS